MNGKKKSAIVYGFSALVTVTGVVLALTPMASDVKWWVCAIVSLTLTLCSRYALERVINPKVKTIIPALVLVMTFAFLAIVWPADNNSFTFI